MVGARPTAPAAQSERMAPTTDGLQPWPRAGEDITGHKALEALSSGGVDLSGVHDGDGAGDL